MSDVPGKNEPVQTACTQDGLPDCPAHPFITTSLAGMCVLCLVRRGRGFFSHLGLFSYTFLEILGSALGAGERQGDVISLGDIWVRKVSGSGGECTLS